MFIPSASLPPDSIAKLSSGAAPSTSPYSLTFRLLLMFSFLLECLSLPVHPRNPAGSHGTSFAGLPDPSSSMDFNPECAPELYGEVF